MGRISVHSQGESGPPDGVWAQVAEIALAQHGVVSSGQLRRCGVTDEARDYQLRTRRLHRIYHAAYAVGHGRLTMDGHYSAAVLAAGTEAGLSYRSAAGLWGLRRNETWLEVTAPRSRDGISGITVHRSRMWLPEDLTERNGIPVTTIARTLLDLAEVLTRPQLEYAVDRAERLELLDLTETATMLDRARGRKRAKLLRRVLDNYVQRPTRSELERRFLDLLERHGLEQPQVNVLVQGERHTHEVDAFWPQHGLVVELDSWDFHRTRRDHEHDAAKTADLELAGLRVARLAWSDVTARSDGTIARIGSHMTRTGIRERRARV